MNNRISIEQINASQVLELQEVALRAYKGHYLHLWYDSGEWYIQKNFSISQLLSELNNANARIYIIYYQEILCGFLKLNINAPLQHEDALGALELERIYLISEASGKGIGSVIMNFVLESATQLNKKTIWLKVMDSSKAAIAFYEKFGFEICGTYHLDFAEMKEEVRGMYIMKRAVNR